MTALPTVLFGVWAIAGAVVLSTRGRGRRAWTTSWAALGLLPILIAAEQGAWQLGEWSRDLTPLPFFGTVALVTVALEHTMARLFPREGEAPGAAPASVAPWLRGAAVSAGIALALLGDSGLALALALALAVAVALLPAALLERAARSELHPTNQ